MRRNLKKFEKPSKSGKKNGSSPGKLGNPLGIAFGQRTTSTRSLSRSTKSRSSHLVLKKRNSS